MSETPMPKTPEELRGFLQTQIKADVAEFLAALHAVGLAIVPKRATEEMIDAGFIDGDTDDIWAAMLSASPYAVKREQEETIERLTKIEAAAGELEKFAFSTLTPSCAEAGEYFMHLLANLRAALSVKP
jgi:hypothetical protein